MGGSYTNVSVPTTDLDLLRSVLAGVERNARVVVVGGGWSVVCDEQSDVFYAPLEPLAEALSAAVDGPVVAAVNFDESTLTLTLHDAGAAVAQCRCDCGDYAEAGGGAAAFVAALAPGADAVALRAALTEADPEDPTFASEHHDQVVRLLGLPDAAVGWKWSYLDDDGAPPYTEIVTVTTPEPPALALLRVLRQPGAFTTDERGVSVGSAEVSAALEAFLAGAPIPPPSSPSTGGGGPEAAPPRPPAGG